MDTELSSHDRTIDRIAELIGCPASLVLEVWQQLDLDQYDNKHALKELRDTADRYIKSLAAAERIQSELSGLSQAERDRLAVERNALIKDVDRLVAELKELSSHRRSVIERTPNLGNKDARADTLAELVALLFEAGNKPITFGHDNGEPTTHFGKVVREVLSITNNTQLESDRHNYITNWRQPASKAFQRR